MLRDVVNDEEAGNHQAEQEQYARRPGSRRESLPPRNGLTWNLREQVWSPVAQVLQHLEFGMFRCESGAQPPQPRPRRCCQPPIRERVAVVDLLDGGNELEVAEALEYSSRRHRE